MERSEHRSFAPPHTALDKTVECQGGKVWVGARALPARTRTRADGGEGGEARS